MSLSTGGALAIGLGSSLLGGLLSSQQSASASKQQFKNQWQLNAQQNSFNSREADKARKWQEDIYKRYNTVDAQTAQYRAAGLNPYIGASAVASSQMAANPVAASGSSGTAALAASNAWDNFGSSAVNSATQLMNAETSKSNGVSSSELAGAQADLLRSQKIMQDNQNVLSLTYGDKERSTMLDTLSVNYKYLQSSLDSRIKMDWCNSMAADWSAMDAQYAAMSRQYSYFNLLPEQVKQVQAQTINFSANALQAFSQHQLNTEELKYVAFKYSIQQTLAQASMINAKSNEKLANGLVQVYQQQADSLEQDVRDKKRLNDYLDGKYFKSGHHFTMFERQMLQNYSMTQKTIQKIGSERGLNINLGDYYKGKQFTERFGIVLGAASSLGGAAILKGK